MALWLRRASFVVLSLGIVLSMPGISLMACIDPASDAMKGMAMPVAAGTATNEDASPGALPDCCQGGHDDSESTDATDSHCVMAGACGALMYAAHSGSSFDQAERLDAIANMQLSTHLALVLPPDSPPPRV